MNTDNINKIIFDSITTVTNTDDFSFTVDDDDDVIQFIYRDNIIINIEYGKEPLPWEFDKTVKYPASIEVVQKYNPTLNEFDIVYYSASAVIDQEETTGDRLVVILGDGRTEKFRNIVDFSKHIIPKFVSNIIHQWLPRHIVYRNLETSKDYCSKSMYMCNQLINVYDSRTVDKYIGAGVAIPITIEKSFRVQHNSGYTYTMNRIQYNVLEHIKEDDFEQFTVQFPIKMLDGDIINKDRPAQENTYIFTVAENFSGIKCEEIYTKKKGKNVSRIYSFELDLTGIISAIKYHSADVGSEVTRVKKITRKGNTFTVTNIFDEDGLKAYN